MNRIGRVILLLGLLSLGASRAVADDTDTNPPGTPVAVDETHPIYSSDARWIASVLVGIGGLFLAAVVVGRLVRSEALDVVPVAISHEEDPAADHVL